MLADPSLSDEQITFQVAELRAMQFESPLHNILTFFLAISAEYVFLSMKRAFILPDSRIGLSQGAFSFR